MVTLAGTQTSTNSIAFTSDFGLPIFEITLEKRNECCNLAGKFNQPIPNRKYCFLTKTDFRIFGKPTSRPYRRMAVALVNDTLETQLKKW
jgi:phosphoribosylglycinamide formyltransferase 2